MMKILDLWNMDRNLFELVSTAIVPVLLLMLLFGKQIRRLLGSSVKEDEERFHIPSLPPFESLWNLFASREMAADIMGLIKSSYKLGSPIYHLPVLSSTTFGKPVYATGDRKIARQILEDPKSTKPYWGYKVVFDAAKGPNLFASEGLRWKHSRKGIRSAFSIEAIRERVRECEDSIVDNWLKNDLKAKVDANESFDVLEQMQGNALRILAWTLFDYHLSQTQVDGFIQGLDDIFDAQKLLVTNPLRIIFHSAFEANRRADQASLFIYSLGYEIINSYKNKKKKEREQNGETNNKPCMLDLMLANDQYTSDTDRVRDIFVILVAGYDTEAIGLSFAFRDLAYNPDILQKLRTEIKQVGIQSSQLLKNVIQETHRLNPGAALGPSRMLGTDMTFTNGPKKQTIHLKKGSIVINCFLAIHRNPKIFDEPDVFKPSRWENATSSQYQSVMPFAVGRRNCIGQSLAQETLKLVIGKAIQEYDFHVEQDGGYDNWFVMKPNNLILSATKAAP